MVGKRSRRLSYTCSALSSQLVSVAYTFIIHSYEMCMLSIINIRNTQSTPFFLNPLPPPTRTEKRAYCVCIGSSAGPLTFAGCEDDRCRSLPLAFLLHLRRHRRAVLITRYIVCKVVVRPWELTSFKVSVSTTTRRRRRIFWSSWLVGWVPRSSSLHGK